MKKIKGHLYPDDSWWAIRRGKEEPTAFVCSVEVHDSMVQSKMFAVHAEADTKSELIVRVEVALAELKGGSAPAAEVSTKSEKAAKSEKVVKNEKAAKGAAKITLDAVKQGLTKLRAAIGGDDDPEKAGIKAVKKLLKQFGVAQSPDLKEEQYADVMAAIDEAMPKEEEAESGGEEF